MLGLESNGVVLAYLFCIFSALLCVVYGVRNWNKPSEDQAKEIEEEIVWEKVDAKISEEL